MKRMTSTLAAAFSVLLAASPAAGQDVDGCRLLFGFDSAAGVAAWEITDDDVMGGKSKGRLRFESGALVFLGQTNTDGGGFSSVGIDIDEGSLGDAQALKIRIRGDGRRYLFSAENGVRRRLFFRAQYWSEFTAPAGGWTELTLPIADFRPHHFGEPIDARTLEGGDIDRLGFFIYDKQDGPFRLEVAQIWACDRT